MSSVILSTAYLPNIHWFSEFVKSDDVTIEACEFFEKQSYRNRCEILTANGKLSLTIPLKRQSDKEIISGKKISYAENWQIKHWRAITSAYKNSPYFEYFEDEFKSFYEHKHEFLLNYNTDLLKLILKTLRIKKNILFTNEYSANNEPGDLRSKIHPKEFSELPFPAYTQVFSDKFGFVPNLSVIDLLFNKGLETNQYLPHKV